MIHRCWLALPVLGAALLFGIDGCTSVDEGTRVTGDAGSPADPTPGVVPDGGSVLVDAGDDSGCPVYTGSDPYCVAVHARCRQCATSLEPCEIDNLASCGATSAAYSEAARTAASKCFAPACGTGGDESCIRSVLSSAPTTPAQEQLVSAFCASCSLGAGPASCASRFFLRTPDGGAVPGPGPGLRVKTVNDALVAEIGKACLPLLGDAGDACENVFFFCSNQTLAGAFPPNACRDPGK